jgi:hypothetical protein
MSERRLALDDGSLVDVLDRLLDVGACIDGTVLLTLADVDLVRLDLRLLLASIETLRPPDADSKAEVTRAGRPNASGVPPTTGLDDRPRPGVTPADHIALPAQHRATPERHGAATSPGTGGPPPSATPKVHTAPDLDAEGADDTDRNTGIAGLVVVLVDIVRQLLERQALRRMDAGTLTDTEIERLGQALMALEQQTAELTEFLGRQRQQRRQRRRRGHRGGHVPPVGDVRRLPTPINLPEGRAQP